MGEKNDLSVKVVDPSRRRDCEALEKQSQHTLNDFTQENGNFLS